MPSEMTEHKSESRSIEAPARVNRVQRLIATPNHRTQILLQSQSHQQLSGLRGGERCCWERWAFWFWQPPFGSVFPTSC